MKSTALIDRLPPSLGTPLGRWRRHYLDARRIRKLKRLRTRSTPTGYTLKSFDEYRCIFVHIPKCAGVSISHSLFGNLGAGHHTLATYQQVFTATEFEHWFKFAFVRNPWDRTLSAYRFLKRGGFHQGDRRWAEQYLGDCPDFPTFVRQRLRRPEILEWEHFRPQYPYLCDRDGRLRIDFVGRYERLEEDFRELCRQLGVERELERLNAAEGPRSGYHDHYDEDTRAIVAEVYAEDIRSLGYAFDPTQTNRANSSTPSNSR